MKLTKEQLINSACDLFGYSSTDFDDMSAKDIKYYLDSGQNEEIEQYNS